MPRLPTIRVIGSQFISTRLFFPVVRRVRSSVTVAILSVLSAVFRGLVSGDQLVGLAPPLGLTIGARIGNGPQSSDHHSVRFRRYGGDARARRFIHEWHELVGKAWHGAGDANAANVRTAANAPHPAALGHVAIHHRPPAAELHQAFRR